MAVLRVGRRGPWPTRCPDCARLERRRIERQASARQRAKRIADPEKYAGHFDRERARLKIQRAAHPDWCKKWSAKYNAAHRAENRQRLRDWRARNRTMVNAYAHRRRARVAGVDGEYTPEQLVAQYERQKGRCFWCSARMGDVPHADYQPDHVVPIALGGSNDINNIVASCPSCNAHKHVTHPMDYGGVMC